MKDDVRVEDINRFDELYHLYIGQGIASKPDIPELLKDLSPIDISVVRLVSASPDMNGRRHGLNTESSEQYPDKRFEQA